jgi:hypothetical protein
MPLDGPWTEVKLCADLGIGVTNAGEASDRRFLRREFGECFDTALSDGLTRCEQLSKRRLCEPVYAGGGEGLVGSPKFAPGCGPPPPSPQPHSVEKSRPSKFYLDASSTESIHRIQVQSFGVRCLDEGLASSLQAQSLVHVRVATLNRSKARIWHTPFVQHCDKVVRKAYPSDKITPPTNPISGSDQTSFSVEAACINVALFTTIAKAAGKDLTVASFEKAGYGLRNTTIPGSAAPVSFGPGRSYPLGPVIKVTYDPAHNVLAFAKSASET